MHKYAIFTLFSILLLKTISAQDYPYPQEPQNLSTLNLDSILFTWKGADNFDSYTIELYNCDYYPGDNFNSINLDDYTLSYDRRVSQGSEVSGFTNHEKRSGTFVGVEDSGSDLLFHTLDFNSNSTYPISNFAGSDFEGITYLHNDYFVIMEERFGYLHFIKFIYNNLTLTNVTLENTITLNDPLISGQNDGFEGVTYNPVSGKMYASKEYNPVTLFEFDLPDAPNFSGSPTLSKPFDINQVSWTPQDASGLYHLGLNKALSATKAGEHLLILSKHSKAIYETDLNGNLISQLDFDISGILGSIVGSEFKAEGITFHDGIIWVAEDNNGLYIGFENFNHQTPVAVTSNLIYNQSNINTTQISIPSCLLQAQTEYCWKVTAHTTNGENIDSEYFSFTTSNLTDMSQGTVCNDNDPCTTNDVYDGNCNCIGTPSTDSDADGVCNTIDTCPNLNNNLIGTACNDGNALTVNDIYTYNCNCEGTIIVCDPLGTPCNDNDSCTIGDVEDGNCNCAGISTGDSDGDGICNAIDVCPNLNDSLIGTACDDGNINTINDVYTSSCICSGTLPVSSICILINNSNDDVEENGTDGSMYFTSTDLEFVYDGNNRGNQTIGLRFNDVPVEQGDSIFNAYIQFTTDETNTGSTNLTIQGENVDHSDVFNTSNQNISSRQKTAASVSWNPSNWSQVGQAGSAQRTPDISDIIQEIIDRQGYSSGNSISLIIDGNGERTAESFEGSATQAPQLCIDYSTVISCPAQGTACDDGSSCTTNDVMIDGNCTCEGTPVAICNTDICLGDVEIVNPVDLCNCIATQTQITGCIDVNACNFLPTANCNDNSCTYAPPINLVHQNPSPILGGIYAAQQTIQSNINFTDMDTVHYYAEVHVELMNDFTVPVGKPFTALIQSTACQ